MPLQPLPSPSISLFFVGGGTKKPKRLLCEPSPARALPCSFPEPTPAEIIRWDSIPCGGLSRPLDFDLSQFIDAITHHKPWLKGLLNSSGALPSEVSLSTQHPTFDRVDQDFGYDELPYDRGAASRTNVINLVFTTNESPPDQKIPFHKEMGQSISSAYILWLKYSSLRTTHAQYVKNEKAANKLVDESGQKIVMPLGEVEQLKADMAMEKTLGIEYRAEFIPKDSELAQSKVALATLEKFKQSAIDYAWAAKAETKMVEAELEEVQKALKASKDDEVLR
ncbi:hypothetical protein NE237_007015 [Protea cynaroides]|uniref:Uncharacterized protein n=1 Tax=Protea cynaroides TaxID=273540 RepID=A0A9Q0KNM4_9MAGN|nr:hypothetical protein NE237_007015 [Protea cynaroides]